MAHLWILTVHTVEVQHVQLGATVALDCNLSYVYDTAWLKHNPNLPPTLIVFANLRKGDPISGKKSFHSFMGISLLKWLFNIPNIITYNLNVFARVPTWPPVFSGVFKPISDAHNQCNWREGPGAVLLRCIFKHTAAYWIRNHASRCVLVCIIQY